MHWQQLIEGLEKHDYRCLARSITLVENELPPYLEILENLSDKQCPVVGFTGPPGAGKSTVVNAILSLLLQKGKRVGLILVDPSSPFNHGALLGDRIRMAENFTKEGVFIRSMASRGSLGGLCDKIIETTDLMKSAGFDLVLIETVGVGQSEVEIAGLADTTVLVLVPEAGDGIQAMKSGLLEVGDVFIVNKSDRPGAEEFANNLRMMLHERNATVWQIPVLQTVAHENRGIAECLSSIIEHNQIQSANSSMRSRLLSEKALRLIQQRLSRHLTLDLLQMEIEKEMKNGSFHLYRYVKNKTN